MARNKVAAAIYAYVYIISKSFFMTTAFIINP